MLLFSFIILLSQWPAIINSNLSCRRIAVRSGGSVNVNAPLLLMITNHVNANIPGSSGWPPDRQVVFCVEIVLLPHRDSALPFDSNFLLAGWPIRPRYILYTSL